MLRLAMPCAESYADALPLKLQNHQILALGECQDLEVLAGIEPASSVGVAKQAYFLMTPL